MVEPIMYLAIGFLVSMLFGLMIVPLVHNRAVRLTTRRLEAATPLSMAEIQADKDQLRAEFAMSARRLEMSVDQLKNKTTSQLAELGKKSDAINRMKLELGEKNATIFALEAREKAMKDQLRTTEEEFTAKTEALRQAEQALSDKRTELAKINTELSDRSMMAESRQVELLAVRAQIDALKGRVDDAEKEFVTTQTRLEQQRGESDTATRELTEARSRAENLSQRVTDLDRQLIVQVKEAEMLGNRVNDLETRLATQGKLLAERDYENNQLRQLNEAAERTARELRDEIAAMNGGKSPALDKLRAEKAAVEEQLRVARDERSKLQRDINAIQQQAESSWATERMENALLRERINDIAAEVAKLAMQLEGPNSPIEAMLAAEPVIPANATRQRNRDQRRCGQWRHPRRRRHARRAHPRPSIPRLPRPPARRVRYRQSVLTRFVDGAFQISFVDDRFALHLAPLAGRGREPPQHLVLSGGERVRGTLDRLDSRRVPLTRSLRYRFVSDLSPHAGRGKSSIGHRHSLAISRRDSPEFCQISRPRNQRAQGMPGAWCARSLACRVENTRVSHHGHTGNTRHSPRNGFNGFLRALPGDRALLSPSSAE